MQRAFLIGNVAIDEVFRVGSVPSLGQSVLGRRSLIGLGGKGANQAVALSRTGVRTTLVAALGDDSQGGQARQALAREECLIPVLITRPNIPSDRSIIMTGEDGGNAILTTNDCARSLTIADCWLHLTTAQPGDVVLLQGNLDLDVTATIVERCRAAQLKVVLNPSPVDPAFSKLVSQTTAVFVNETEAQALTGLTGRNALAALLKEGAQQVVLTLGADGALLGSKTEILHIPAIPTKVMDATGAGDCFEAVAIGSSLMRQQWLDANAIRHATKAAAQSVRRLGATDALPSADDLSAILADAGA